MASTQLSILIVGANGRLGSLITQHCLLNPKLRVNIMVHNLEKNPKVIDQVLKSGGKVFEGDLEHPETLKDATKGMHTVINATFINDPVKACQGEIALIDEAVKNKVERYCPAIFSINIENFPREEISLHPFHAVKLSILEYLKSQPIKTLYFCPGLFVDSFFELHPRGYGFWGNRGHKYNLSTREDTAKYVAAAVADGSRTGRVLLSSYQLTIDEITDVYNKVRRAKLVAKKFGSLEDGRKVWEELKKEEPTSEDSVLFGILLLVFDDRSEFMQTDNKEFPEVKTMSVEDYLFLNATVKLPE